MIDITKFDVKLEIQKKILFWKIDGQFIHGIKPNTFLNITPKFICNIYNVNYTFFN